MVEIEDNCKRTHAKLSPPLCALLIAVLGLPAAGGTIDDFLKMRDPAQKKALFTSIVEAPSDHRESIRAKLTSYAGMTARDIGDVLYLATLIRDTSFVSPIVNMVTDKSYSGGACVYSCPCVFALVTFTAFSEADSLPPMDQSITAVSDYYSDLRYVRTMSLEQRVSRVEYADDAKNEQMTEMLALSEAELVSRAEEGLSRHAAESPPSLRAIPRGPRYSYSVPLCGFCQRK